LRRTHIRYDVIDKGYTTPCWIWQGCTREGYGMKQNLTGGPSKMMQAHVYYYELAKGKVPAGLILDHLCNQRACVNPDHLEPKTHKANIRRGKVPVVTKEIAAKIKELYSTGKWQQSCLAAAFKISQPTVSQIIRGITWN